MKLNLNFVCPAISQKDGQNHLIIEVCPEKQNVQNKPNAWVFVIDKSGSMNEILGKSPYSRNYYTTTSFSVLPQYNNHEQPTKLEYAKSSIISFLQKLNPTDKVGIVAFNSSAYIVENLTYVKNSSDIITKLNSLNAGGCTNIDAGINLAYSLFTSEEKEKYNCKILLLSDGETNEGRTSVDALSSMTLNFLKAGITTSCLGVGNYYNSFLLNKMSTTGGGYLYHIDTLDKLNEIFEQELTLSNSVLAKKVEVSISTPTYLEIEENLNNYHEENSDDFKNIFIGDLSTNRKIAIGIKNNHRTKNATFTIKCSYIDLDGSHATIEKEISLSVVKDVSEFKKNTDLLDYVMSLIEANTMSQGLLWAEQGNEAEINTAYSNSISMASNCLRSYNMDDKYQKAVLDSMNCSFTTCSQAANSGDTSSIKAKYSTTTNTTRQ